MCSLHPNILKNPILILLIVNVPTAEPPLVRGRLEEHRESDSEVRSYSDDGKLKIMKYISFDVINIFVSIKSYSFRLMKYLIKRNSDHFNWLPQRVF